MSGAVLFVLLVAGALAVRGALAAADDLEQARSALDRATTSPEDVEQAAAVLTRARRMVREADRELDSPAPRLFAAVPLVGRSWDAQQAVVDAAGSALAAAELAVQAAPAVRAPGGADLLALTDLARRLRPLTRTASADFARLETSSTALTPPAVATGVRDAVTALRPVVQQLVGVGEGAGLAASLLGRDGQRRVLVALQNNAELRGTGGYVSSFATGRTEAGRLVLGPFRDVLDVNDPPERAREVPAPRDFVEDYAGSLANTTLFREWTMTPHVPDAASVAANAVDVLLGERPDVVLLLDVPALAALVELSGEGLVLPGGETVPADRVVEALLVDAYARAGGTVEAQDARRAALQAAAGSTLSTLLSDGLSPTALVQEIGSLARGRHLALWSARPEEQGQLEELGLAGAVSAEEGGDLACISVNNLRVNKLDYYIDRSVTVEARVEEQRAQVVQRVVLTNRAPADLVPYVAGLETPGTTTERVELAMPPAATFDSLRVGGRPAIGGVTRGRQRNRAHTFVTLGRGKRVELELRYSLPVEDGRYRLQLVPQALARDAELEVVVRAGPGTRVVRAAGARMLDGAAVREGRWQHVEVLEVEVASTANPLQRLGGALRGVFDDR